MMMIIDEKHFHNDVFNKLQKEHPEASDMLDVLKMVLMEMANEAKPANQAFMIKNLGKDNFADILTQMVKEASESKESEETACPCENCVLCSEDNDEASESERKFIFWNYDCYPYMLGGELTETFPDGSFKVKGYETMTFSNRAFIATMPYETGKFLYENIVLKLRDQYTKVMAAQDETARAVKELLRALADEEI